MIMRSRIAIMACALGFFAGSMTESAANGT